MTRSPKPTSEQSDRARRAVAEFRRMLPSITSYARAMTGDRKLRVKISATSGGSSAPGVINYAPPIQLGDKHEHDLVTCDKRNELGLQICKACRVREFVLAVIYHEVGHLSKGTFVAPRHDVVTWYRKNGYRWLYKNRDKYSWGRDVDKAMGSVTEGGVTYEATYMGLANRTHEFMGPMLNAIEDARVNEMMFEARPGTRPMYFALITDLSHNGVPIPHGSDNLVPWVDMDANFQVILAVYSYLAGFEYDEWFSPEIITALKDRHLRAKLAEFDTGSDAHESFKLAVDLMRIVNRLGYCIPKEDEPKPETESDTDGGSADGGEGEGQSSGSSPGKPDKSDESDNSSSDPTNQSNEGESDKSGQSTPGKDEADKSKNDTDDLLEKLRKIFAGEDDELDDGLTPQEMADDIDTGEATEGIETGAPEGNVKPCHRGKDIIVCAPEMIQEMQESAPAPGSQEEATEQQALKVAIAQGIWFQTPSVYVRDILYYKLKDFSTWPSIYRYGNASTPDARTADISSGVSAMRLVLEENQRRAHRVNLKSGKVRTKVLGARAPVGREDLFHKRVLPGKKDYAHCVMLDLSGSLMGTNLEIEKNAAYAKAEILAKLGLPFAMFAHTSGGQGFSDRDMVIYEIKPWDAPWDSRSRNALLSLEAQEGNLDGHAFEFGIKQLLGRTETDKILWYYTDGKMPAENHAEELEVLQRELRTAKKRGITYLGVGIRTDSPRQHGMETIELNSTADVPMVIRQLKKYL